MKLLRLWWKLWDILGRKIHTHAKLCSLFQGAPRTSEACIRTPDTESVLESERHVQILHDVSDFMSVGSHLSTGNKIKSIRVETSRVHIYFVTLHPHSQFCSHHLENIFSSFGSNWWLLVPRQWLVYMCCILFLLGYKRFIDLTINSFAWFSCKPSVSGFLAFFFFFDTEKTCMSFASH